MRILHILDHSAPLHSGYAFRTLSILQQQRARGWHTIQLTGPKQGPVRAYDPPVEGCHFFRTPVPTARWCELPLMNHVAVITALEQRLERVVALTCPDILHAHSPALNAVASLKVARKLGLPLVYEIRAFWEDAAVDHGSCVEGGLRYRASRALETYAAKRASAVTTICDGLRNALAARGVAPAAISVIPNGVNLDHFAPDCQRDDALARTLDLGAGPTIGFIGSFYAYEGLALLIDAMPRMLRSWPSLKLLLVGGGPQQQELREHVSARGVSGSVIFCGRVPHEQVPQYYSLIDVLVYPRQRMRLTDLVTPLKPLEAMAQGRLVVASDVGGHRELIEHERTGILFKAGDGEALAAAVLALLACPGRWPDLRASARHFVQAQRTWPACVARYEPVYAALLSRKHTQ